MRKILYTFLVISFFYFTPLTLQAQTLYVSTTGTDSMVGACAETSPCRNIGYALAHSSSGNTIQVAAGTYAPFVVNQNVTIRGAGAANTIIDGEDRARAVLVNSGFTVSLEDFGITRGNAGRESGGGILNGGNLTLNRVWINANSADNGAGVTNLSLFTTATLNLNSSTLSLNRANVNGGGLYNHGNLKVINSTIAHNTANANGGGVYNDASALFVHSTIVGNVADFDTDASGTGGGIYDAASASSRGSLIALNQRGSSGPVANDCSGDILSWGSNLLGNNLDCTFRGGSTDQVGTSASPLDPQLGTLDYHWGPTPVYSLAPTSSALNRIPTDQCADVVLPATRMTTDQRGMPRPYGGDCDIGAFEASPLIILHPFGSNSYDFGNVTVGTSRDVLIALQNVGDLPLRIEDPTANLPVFQAHTNCRGREIAPGDFCMVTLTFRPTAATNYFDDITFTSNAAVLNRFTYAVRGNGSATATPSGDFSIALGSSTASVSQGGTVNVPVTITRTSGFSGEVAVSLSGAPAGITADPMSISSGSNAGILILHVATSVSLGSRNIVIQGSSASLTHITAPLSLNVTAPAATPPPVVQQNALPGSPSTDSGGCSMNSTPMGGYLQLLPFLLTMLALVIRRRK